MEVRSKKLSGSSDLVTIFSEAESLVCRFCAWKIPLLTLLQVQPKKLKQSETIFSKSNVRTLDQSVAVVGIRQTAVDGGVLRITEGNAMKQFQPKADEIILIHIEPTQRAFILGCILVLELHHP